MSLRGASGLTDFFLLTYLLSAIKGEHQLIGPPEPVEGLVGDDVILPCGLQPAQSVTEKTVEWTRSNMNPRYVHIFREGRLLYDDQNPSFQQRTSLFEQELKNGNMSLKLRRLKLADNGTYTCKLVTSKSVQSIEVSLVVGAVSEPKISPERPEGGRLVLKCDAENWYPKPEMEWRDRKGRIIPHDNNNTEYDEYYSVHSRITVKMTADDIYTCIVRQHDIRQSRESNYTLPYNVEVVSKNAVAAIVTLSIMFVLALILMYLRGWRFRCLRTLLCTDEIDGPSEQAATTEHQRNLQERLLPQENQQLKMEISHLRRELEMCRRENESLRRRPCCSHVQTEPKPQRSKSW